MSLFAVTASWPEVAIAVTAAIAQGWVSWLAYQQSRENGRRMEESTVIARSTDTTHDARLGAGRRADEEQ